MNIALNTPTNLTPCDSSNIEDKAHILDKNYLKNALEKRISALGIALGNYESAVHGVNFLIPHTANCHEYRGCLKSLFERFLSDICVIANKTVSNRSHKTIITSDIYKVIHHGPYGDKYEDAVSDFLHSTDLDQLVTNIKRAIDTTENQGFADAADTIASFLNLIKCFSNRLEGTQKGKQIVTIERYQDDWHSRYNEEQTMHKYKVASQTFAAESQVHGLASIFGEFIEISNQYNGKAIPSRTKIDGHQNVNAIIFNSSLKLFIDPILYEALQSFVVEYSTRELIL